MLSSLWQVSVVPPAIVLSSDSFFGLLLLLLMFWMFGSAAALRADKTEGRDDEDGPRRDGCERGENLNGPISLDGADEDLRD